MHRLHAIVPGDPRQILEKKIAGGIGEEKLSLFLEGAKVDELS